MLPKVKVGVRAVSWHQRSHASNPQTCSRTKSFLHCDTVSWTLVRVPDSDVNGPRCGLLMVGAWVV